MKSVFSSTKRSCSMHCPVLLRHLTQNTGVKIVYVCNDTEIHSFINIFISCFAIFDKMLSLFRDRVLAMARDLLQFRASCAKSRHS